MNRLTFKQKLWVYLVALIVIVSIATFVFHNTFYGIVVFAVGYFLYTRTIEPHEGPYEGEDDSVIDVEDVTEEEVVEDKDHKEKNKEN